MAENEIIKKRSKKAKVTKFVFFVVFIFVISGISSIFSEKYIFPWLATQEWFKKQVFFQEGNGQCDGHQQDRAGDSERKSGYFRLYSKISVKRG